MWYCIGNILKSDSNWQGTDILIICAAWRDVSASGAEPFVSFEAVYRKTLLRFTAKAMSWFCPASSRRHSVCHYARRCTAERRWFPILWGCKRKLSNIINRGFCWIGLRLNLWRTKSTPRLKPWSKKRTGNGSSSMRRRPFYHQPYRRQIIGCNINCFQTAYAVWKPLMQQTAKLYSFIGKKHPRIHP